MHTDNVNMEKFELKEGRIEIKESKNKESKVLYHYTANVDTHLGMILQTGYLKLTRSSLLKAQKHWVEIINGVKTFCSDVDDYKPVVWMTNKKSGEGLGIDIGMSPAYVDAKKEICITIRMKDSFKWWNQWADENRMNKSWRKTFTSGLNYGAWYISEEPILLEDIELIENVKTGEILYDNRKYKCAA